MTLQVSGPISIADASYEVYGTTFSNMSLDSSELRSALGSSAGTQASFNDFYGKSLVPVSPISFVTSGSGVASYLQFNQGVTSLSVNSTGTVFVWMTDYSGKNYVKVVNKWRTEVASAVINVSGTVTTKNALAAENGDTGCFYVVGSGNNSNRAFIMKINPFTQTIVWQKYFAVGTYCGFYSCTVDTSNNPIAVGYAQMSGTVSYAWLIKFDGTNGNITWEKYLTTDQTQTNDFESVATDTSGNIYVSGHGGAPGGGVNGTVCAAKYSSTGSLLWHRKFTPNSGSAWSSTCVVDQTGALYAGFINNGTGYNGVGIIKWDTSGNYQWAKDVSQSGQLTAVQPNISIDRTNSNIFMAYKLDFPENQIHFSKWDYSGTQLWVNKIIKGPAASYPSMVNGINPGNIAYSSVGHLWLGWGQSFNVSGQGNRTQSVYVGMRVDTAGRHYGVSSSLGVGYTIATTTTSVTSITAWSVTTPTSGDSTPSNSSNMFNLNGTIGAPYLTQYNSVMVTN